MKTPPCFSIRRLALLAFSVFAAPLAWAQLVTFTPLKSSGIYNLDEKVGWEITVPEGRALGTVNYTLKKNGLDVYKTGQLDLSSGKATLTTTLGEPGAVLLEIQAPPSPEDIPAEKAEITGGRGRRPNRAQAGAMIEPEKLQPSSPRPADFDAWWEAKIKQLHAIPANPQLTPADGEKEEVEYSLVRMDNINGTHIYGQLAKPKRGGKFPALLILQWAGVYPLEKQWVTARAAEGWLVLNIEAHDLPGDQPKEFYAGKIPNYWTFGQDDKDQSYFLRMYLSAYRAADYLTESPDWDGRTFVVKGDSMGGQQSFAVAGLHPKVTALMTLVPSSCDLTGPLHGRAAGFPDWARNAQSKNNPKILETGQYFDPVNFASRIKVPALVAMGFFDETSPPTGVWCAINQLAGPKEPLSLINSGHQNVSGSQRPWQTRSAAWLAKLVEGESIK
jgi:cephalosporin-C deacetylase